MDLLPNLNDPVVIRDQADREYLSRVEDVSVGLLVVARPLDLPADEVFGPGTEVVVVWSDDAGVAVALPTRIMASHAEGPLQLWSVAATGPAFREQRRRFVRAAAIGPVLLLPPTETDADPVPGSLVDVSEAAIRCTVEAGTADVFLTGRGQVVAEFGFGDARFTVPGRVEFLRATARPSEVEELVVIFDEPVAAGDALRKQIFDQEARSLRSRRENPR